MSEIDPVRAVDDTIAALDLHADDLPAKPDATSVDVNVNLKAKTASVEITESLP